MKVKYPNGKKIKILVILHLFYMNNWEYIKQYLKNIDIFQFDLYVSFSEEHKDEQVLCEIKKHYPRVTFQGYRNKGYDVGPFFECLQNIKLDDYDIVYKLHSKGRNIAQRYCYGRLFKRDDWFKYLYESILGRKVVNKVINKLMSDKQVGLVAANNLIIQDPEYKINLTMKWAEKIGCKQIRRYKFVAGTCFAIKAELLKEIQEWNISLNDFELVRRGKFSLAHALERLICVSVQEQGYQMYGINTCIIRQVVRKVQAYFIKKSNSSILFHDKRFQIDDEFFYSFLESKYIKKYDIVTIKLKDIRREWKGKYYTLQECAPYKYLEGATEQYKEYCKINSQNCPYDMSVDRFDKLIRSYKEGVFDTRYIPIINEKNIVLDGQHRMCILLKEYGPEFEVKVLKIECKLILTVSLSRKDVEALKNESLNNSIYIYGAGIYGEKYWHFLKKKGINIKGVVVTKRGEQMTFFGTPIYEIDEIQEPNAKFVLALNEKNRKEVEEILKEKRFTNYI